MKKSNEKRIERDIKEEKEELILIEENIKKIRENLLEKIPSKFSRRDILSAFFGSLFFGLTFVLKGGVVRTAKYLETPHIILIIITTLLILMTEIYFIAYTRVKNRMERRPAQFMIKRLFTLYTITLVVTVGLIYLLNLNGIPGVDNVPFNVLKLVIVVSFPCAVGAAVPSLLKKY